MEPISSLIDPLAENEEEELDDKTPRSRLFWFSVLVVVLLGVILARLYYLQVVQGANLREQADNNRFREIAIPASRGVIYDRHKAVLARNRPTYEVGFVPADLPDLTQRDQVIRRLADVLGVPAETLLKRDTSAELASYSPFDFVSLDDNVSQNLAFTVEERHRDLPGINLRLLPTRDYVDGALTAPFLGYIGRISADQYARLKDDTVHRYSASDLIGQAGLERTFENQLRGQPGNEQMEVDATGREVSVLQVTSPQPGNNLVLTIDQKLQRTIGEAVTANLARYGSASVVALDPRNGQVLAMVHLPSYDNNVFSNGISAADYQKLISDPHHPLINGAVGLAYPPGEIFHLITALAGLETSVVKPTTQIDCPGYITVPNRFDPTVGTRLFDWKAFGPQDVESALADSCNVYFYQVGGGDPNGQRPAVGVDGLARFAMLYGLGQPTGVDLAEEVPGLVPSVRWKRQEYNQEWVPMDTYQFAVGEGYVTATPIQLANLAAAIANGGTLYRPQLVMQILDDQGNVVTGFTPDPIRQIPAQAGNLAAVRQGMVDATTQGKTPDGTAFDGTAKNAAVPGWTVAGLTANVPYGPLDKNGNQATHGWFVGYAPADHPVVAVAVFVENGTGQEDAAKLAQVIFNEVKQSPP